MKALSPLEMYGACKPPGEELVMAHLGISKRESLPSWNSTSSSKSA